MYLKHWNLKEQPFLNVPKSGLFFPSPQHEEAVIRLSYVAQHRKGVAMLTGEVGSGKTTVARALMNHLPKDKFETQMIVNPALSPTDMLKAILLKFGENAEKAESDSKPILLDRLQTRFAQNMKKGITTVLIIDEVHVIKDLSTFEELRMLLNMQSDDEFLVTLILLGQPLLLKKISELQPLKERISIKYHLEPLDSENTWEYIAFRLKNSGSVNNIFTKDAVRLIYETSEGIPLRINNLCDRSLLVGLMSGVMEIDVNIVNEAIEDLR
ncbi:AAA family ATPase [Desulfobacterales bacterium HSG17]|nr:AAA family ATPase [Desulfobacterales bacterium HSG17]